MKEKPTRPAGVPRSHFTTRHLPPGQKFAAWRESIDFLFDVRLDDRLEPEAFDASVDVFLADELAMGVTTGGSQGFERSRLRVARDGIDNYLIQVYSQGGTEVETDRATTLARPGDILILDNAQAMKSRVDSYSIHNLVVPRYLLAPLLADPDGQNGRVIPGNAPLAALLRGHMISLYENAPYMTLKEGQMVVRPTIDLLAAAINSDRDSAGQAGQAIQIAQMTRIKNHIEANLGWPELSAETIARDLGLSRAGLYRIAERLGGIATYVRDRRLRRCLQDLTHPARQHLRISDIAWNWGFTDQAGFSRAFRRAFGMTPSEAREASQQRKSETAHGLLVGGRNYSNLPVGDRDYEEWMRDLLSSAR